MNREGHKDVVYFIGPEVEHTPAYSKKTLFVVGMPPIEQIMTMANEYKTPHVFMGANQSFTTNVDEEYGSNRLDYWDKAITALLDKGFWVTLDYPAQDHEQVLTMLNPGIWQSRIFVPMLSVRIPKVETSSPNLTVKIDDIDFKATNDGVWCLHYHQLLDSNRFTDWQDYGSDEVVAPISGPVPNPVTRISVPVHADINTPKPKLEKIKEIVESKKTDEEVMNPQDLGLDPDSPSQLKADPEETVVSTPVDAVDAAAAYAEGAKEDPLGKETSKKPKKSKVEQ